MDDQERRPCIQASGRDRLAGVGAGSVARYWRLRCDQCLGACLACNRRDCESLSTKSEIACQAFVIDDATKCLGGFDLDTIRE